MLASLLPGIRELRAPLAAGYTWLFGLWLALHQFLPPNGQATGLLRDLINLGDWSGKPAIFAALSFIAYILGILSIAALHVIDSWLSDLLRPLRDVRFIGILIPGSRWTTKVRDALEDAVANKLANRFLSDEEFRAAVMENAERLTGQAKTDKRLSSTILHYSSMSEQELKDDYYARWLLLNMTVRTAPHVESARGDLPYLAPRLLGREEQIYAEYDRRKAEGNFLAGLIIPLSFIVVTLAVTVSIWWISGAPAPVILAYLAVESWIAADQNLALALSADRVTSPALERVMTDQIDFTSYEELAGDNLEHSIPST